VERPILGRGPSVGCGASLQDAQRNHDDKRLSKITHSRESTQSVLVRYWLNASIQSGYATMGPFFYHAMHFSAKRGIAIACRLSVRLSVCDVGEL